MRHFAITGWRAAWVFFFALAFVFSVSAAGAAEKKPKETEEEKEAKRAAEEDALERATTGMAFKGVTLKGTLALNAIVEGDTTNTVAGTFTTRQGTFLLKCETLLLRKAMLPHNGKEVMLIGKIRNDGKYFVATSIEAKGFTPAAPLLGKNAGL